MKLQVTSYGRTISLETKGDDLCLTEVMELIRGLLI